jgi:hypothetical protein
MIQNAHAQVFIIKEPHSRAQQLHRDGEYAMFQLPAAQFEHEISVIWACHDFTPQMG